MNILFVCTGNTCRSPLAAAILTSKGLSGVEVKSAGVFAMPGNDASAQAQQVLKEQGISYSHLSSQVSQEQVEWADYVLTMTEQHKMLLENSYPGSVGKTFTLKEFVEQDGEVTDPFGGSVATYRETFEELQHLIDLAMRKINK